MKIVDYEVIEINASQLGDWIFVKLITEKGNIGMGEASQSGNDDLLTYYLENELLKGIKNFNHVLNTERYLKKFKRGRINQKIDCFIQYTAISSIEQAIWDIKAKSLDISLLELLGGKNKSDIPLYANINRAVLERSPENFAQVAKEAVSLGYKGVKLAPFDGVKPNQERDKWKKKVEKGFKRISAVHQVIDENCDLMVDCHGRFTSQDIIWLIDKIEKYNIFWLESPVWPNENIEGLRRIRKNSKIRLAGGERIRRIEDVWPLVSEQLLDVIMPDVKHCGGINNFLKIAAVAEAADISIAPHNPSGPISTAISANLSSIIPNLIYLEYPYGEIDDRNIYTDIKEPIKEGNYNLDKLKNYGMGMNIISKSWNNC